MAYGFNEDKSKYDLENAIATAENLANATGTLAIEHGGTGAATVAAARNALGLGNTEGALPVANGGTGATTAAQALTNLGAAASAHNHAASAITSGTLGVARGGTGKATHTGNAVLTGNGTSAVNNVATANGALFATAANGAPKFGTLPVAQGGTGCTSREQFFNDWALNRGLVEPSLNTAGNPFSEVQCQIVYWGAICQIYVAFKNTSALSSNTDYTVGTLAGAGAGRTPIVITPLVSVTKAKHTGQFNTDGKIHLFPATDLPVNSTLYMSGTYLTANNMYLH